METIQLPPTIVSYLKNNDEIEDDNYVIGGILNDTCHAWLSNGSKFIVINLSTAVKTAAWTFGATLRDYKARVTCVYELTTPLIEQTMQLLIGLECELIGGMVCLFHCNGSRILRAIQIDCQIVCLQYVEKINGSPFGCFDGTVIIGTHGGGVFLFDLNKKDCMEAISNINNDIMDELNNANLVVLSIDNINIISQQRTIACEKGHHIAVQINEGCSHNLQFILRDPDNEVKLETDRDQVFVTNILYVSQLESLVIGLSIGAFQVWNLQTLELQFTSPLNVGGLPIAHIGFMEPCDDPRAFCYLWVIHSTLNRHDEGFPIAIMYSLTYEGKKLNKDHKTTYLNFLSCNLRFNLDLTNIDGANNIGKFIGGRSLGCQTLTKAANKDDTDEYVLNICQMVWECWTVSAIAPVQSLMIFFDIDQWYKEQMPEICELKTNNYISLVNLGDIFAHTGNSYLCDVKINSDTLTSYVSVQRLEEHFFPNAIGYECHCLTNTNITKFVTMGVQRQLLASINEIGPSILLHPTKLFHQCISTGLIPLYVDPQPSVNTPEPIQREILLSVALEARLIQFLGKCACDWATGCHSSVGCTLQLLLDWSWKRTLILKQNGDQLAVSFFDHSGEMPDRFTIQCLDNCVRQLGHIAMLYNIIIEKCSNYILPDKIFEIKHCQKIVKMVAQYFQVIQWFLNVGLLPEFSDDQRENDDYRLPYPIQSLVKFYQNRRFKLHCLNDDDPAHEDLKNKHCHFLFIDQFIDIECSGSKLQLLWMQDESTIKGLYPPPSLHSLLKIYLIPDMKEEYKHSLVLYALVDYAMMYDSERYEGVIHRLMQFPTMFGLSNTAIKITQAFWHLDHKDFQLALNQLQCVLAGGCLTQWQHNVVLSALLVQKKTQSALQYLHVRKPCISSSGNEGFINIYDDWDACSNLYLSRGLMYEAFELNKESIKSLPASVHEQRLRVFFDGCRKVGLLSKVVLLPLTQNEESVFINYLKAIDDPQSNDIIVLYYLRRSRYIEAKQANESLKRYNSNAQLPYDVTSDFKMRKEHVHKTEARDQLVDLYYKTLPPITRQLAQYTNTNHFNQKMIIPTPMTVNVQISTHKAASYKSSFIQETIDKANETWLKNPTIVRNLKRAFQIEDTPFLCTPKLTRRSERFDEKMSTTPDGTPAKKIKLNDEADEMVTPENVISPKLKKEIATLLHTPLVERICRNFTSSTKNNRFSSARRSSFRNATPQSILKVKKSHDCLIPSPIDERLTMETDDEIDAVSQYSHSTVSRSIRFNLPSQNSSPHSFDYASDLQDSYNELCGHSINNQESVNPTNKVNITPRKSIHSNHTIVKTPETSIEHIEETQLEDDDDERQCKSKENLETSIQQVDDDVSHCESNNDDQNSVYSVDDNISHRSIDSMSDITSIGPSQSMVKFPRARRSIRECKKMDKSKSFYKSMSIDERFDIMEKSSFISQECSVFNETKVTEKSAFVSEVQNDNTTNVSMSANLINDSLLPSEDESILDTSNATFSISSEIKSLYKKSILNVGLERSKSVNTTTNDSVTEVKNTQSYTPEKSKIIFEEVDEHEIIHVESESNEEEDEDSVVAEADQAIAEDDDFEVDAVETINIEESENDKDDVDQEPIEILDEEPSEDDIVIKEPTEIYDEDSAVDVLKIQDKKSAIETEDILIEEPSEVYDEEPTEAADDMLFEDVSNIQGEAPSAAQLDEGIVEEPSEICNEEPAEVSADAMLFEDVSEIQDEEPSAVALDEGIVEEASEICDESAAVATGDIIEDVSEFQDKESSTVVIDDNVTENTSQTYDEKLDIAIEEPLQICDKAVDDDILLKEPTINEEPLLEIQEESINNEAKHSILQDDDSIIIDTEIEKEPQIKSDNVSIEINDDSNALNNNILSNEEIDSDLLVNEESIVNTIINSDENNTESKEDEDMKLIYNEDDETEENEDSQDLANKAYIEITPENSNQECDTEIKHNSILSESLDSSVKNDTEVNIVPDINLAESKEKIVKEVIGDSKSDLNEKEVKIIATEVIVSETAADKMEVESIATEVEIVNEIAADKTEVESIATEVEIVNETTADKTEVKSIATEVEIVNETTVDKTEVESIATEVEIVNETTADKTEVESIATEVEIVNETTADKTEVKSIATEVEIVNETTVDKTEVESIATEVEIVNETTADKTEVESIATEVEIVNENAADEIEVTIENAVGLNMPSLEHASSNGDSNTSSLHQGTSKVLLPTSKSKYRKRVSSFSSDNSLHIIEENSDSVIVDDSISLEKSTTSTKDDIQSDENVRRRRKRAGSISSLDESRMSSSRRSTRNSSKLDMSFVSQSSMDSDQESTTSSLRKMRRSVLTKPNLSVIPEDERSHLDRTAMSRKNSSTSNIIEEYSSTRRLTRHQRSLLEKSIETSSSLQVEISSTTRDSGDSGDSNGDDEHDNVSHCSSFTEKTLDPILLLDKRDFEGQPDLDECVVCDSAINSSRASSVISDMDVDTGGYSLRKRDLEIFNSGKMALKDYHKSRITPVKMMDSSIDYPSGSGSPSSRPRRMSFNKAIEAICTPKKKKRPSTDSRKSDSDSLNMSLAERLPIDDTIIEETAKTAPSPQQEFDKSKTMTPKKRIISEFAKISPIVEQLPIVKEIVSEKDRSIIAETSMAIKKIKESITKDTVTESPKTSTSKKHLPINVTEKLMEKIITTETPKKLTKRLTDIAEKLIEKANVAQSPKKYTVKQSSILSKKEPEKETVTQSQKKDSVKQSPIVTEKEPAIETVTQAPKKSTSKVVLKREALKEEDKLTELPVIKEKRTRRTSLMQFVEGDQAGKSVKEKRIRKAASLHGDDADVTKDIGSSSTHTEEVTVKKIRKARKASSLHEQETQLETPVRRTRQSIITTPLSKEERMSIISREPTYKRRTGVNKAVQPLEFTVKKK